MNGFHKMLAANNGILSALFCVNEIWDLIKAQITAAISHKVQHTAK